MRRRRDEQFGYLIVGGLPGWVLAEVAVPGGFGTCEVAVQGLLGLIRQVEVLVEEAKAVSAGREEG